MFDVDFRIEPAGSPAAAMLISELDADLIRRYPGQPINVIDVHGFEASGGVFAIGYVAGRPVVCGALRPFEDAAEIKRMFVLSTFRGKGLGRRMLGFMEEEARRRGFSRAVLETGDRQPEATGLYISAGWSEIPAFGSYAGNPASKCFEKRLAGVAGNSG